MSIDSEKQMIEAIEKSIKGEIVDVPAFDEEAEVEYPVSKKRNAVIIYRDKNGFYVKSGYDFNCDYDLDRGTAVAEGYTLREALEAWLLNPSI